MKKMKTKRLFAVLLTLAMVLGMTSMAFAGSVNGDIPPVTDQENNEVEPEPEPISNPAPTPVSTTPTNTKPEAGDKTTATVYNVATGAAVTAYRIVEPNYNDQGFVGYQAVSGVALVNYLEPTSDEVTSIAADKELLGKLDSKSLSPMGTVDAKGLTTYTAELGAGYWVVVVTNLTGEGTQIYNPMLIGVYYSVEGSGDNNHLESGTVDATKKWDLTSTPAYAKSEEPKIDKKITGSTGKDSSDGNESGNDVAIGDTVYFQIDTKIPEYSKAYKKVKVSITDRLGKGLATPAAIEVQVGTGAAITKAAIDADYTLTMDEDNKGFRIDFISAYAIAHSGDPVRVTYEAVLGGDAGLNFDANENTAKLIYTNDPHDENSTKEIEDKTYTYTFAIDSKLFGEEYSWTEELLKTGEVVSGSTVTTKALEGAVFALVPSGSAIESAKESQKARSDQDGHLVFEGLDAGDYILQEIVAPDGYSLNDAQIQVNIKADYNEDGTLRTYVITINGVATSTYTATYGADKKITNITSTPGHTGEANENEVAKNEVSDTYEIKNTKLSSLPSTGGIGTTIFTIAGCLIMILAAALFFASRRKSSKK